MRYDTTTPSNTHYEEFIGSIDSLVTMKQHIHNLKGDVHTLDTQVRESGQEVVGCAKKLVKERQKQSNIRKALEVAQRVHYIINMAKKAKAQIEEKRFFIALKTLDQIQAVHLPAYRGYQFAEKLMGEIPLLIGQTKRSVLADVTTWLEELEGEHRREALYCNPHRHVGAVALAQISDQLLLLKKQRAEALLRRPAKINNYNNSNNSNNNSGGRRQHSTTNNIGGGEPMLAAAAAAAVSAASAQWDPRGLFEQVKCDLAPVFVCLQTFEKLNADTEFQGFYCDRRQAQLTDLLVLQAGPNPTSNALQDMFKNYFARLAGFFLVEDHILKSGNQLMTAAKLEGLWETAIVQIKVTLKTYIESLDTVSFLNVKYTAVLFCKALERTGIYAVDSLYFFFVSQRESFQIGLDRFYQSQVRQLFEQDRCEPMICHSAEEYEKSVLAFGLGEPSMNVTFPLTLPFSTSVPGLALIVKRYTKDYCEYMQHLQCDLSSAVVEAVDALLLFAHSAFADEIKAAPSERVAVSQAVHLAINSTACADKLCPHLRSYAALKLDAALATRTDHLSVTLGAADGVTFLAQAKFSASRAHGEDLLFEIITSKIDTFLSLADGSKFTPSSAAKQPSGYIEDLVTYLRTTFGLLNVLPTAIRSGVILISCKHISSSLINIISSVKAFNILGVSNLHLDVELLERFATGCAIDRLVETFSEIRQFCDLFLSGRLEDILDANIRADRYNHLSPAKLVLWMSKYKQLGILASFGKNDGVLKKKDVAEVARQLQAQLL